MKPADYQFQSEFARRYFSQGKAAGTAEGKAEGTAEGKAELLIKQATLKFGSVPAAAQAQIRGAAVADLDLMGERLMVVTSLEAMLGSAFTSL